MGRLSRVKDRLLGKPKPDGGSKAGSGVSCPSATPPTAPVLPSASAPPSASETPPVPTIIAHPPPEQIVPSAPQPSNPTPAAPVPQPSTPPTASDAASSPSHDVDPWGLAYKIFQEREPELTADYAKHLASLRGETAASIDLSKIQEKKQWRVSLLGRDIKIREQAEKLAKFLLWSDPIVKDALSAQPYAALAWSGVSMLLPHLTSGATQNEAMLKGFNSIGEVQVYWAICDETYLQAEHRQHYERLVEPLAKLYSYIIEYQARVICHLSRTQLSRGPFSTRSAGFSEGGGQTQRIYEDQKERILLQDLASDYEGYKNFNPQKVEGTCEWFLNDDRFRRWRESNTSSLLWVSAGPGCGKSVLSRALIDDHRLSTKVATSTVCHFFFRDGDESRRYSTNALCAILHQLFTQDPAGSLIGNALPSHKNYGEKLTGNFSELWRILLECDFDIACASTAQAAESKMTKLRRDDYTVGWICPLEVEQTAALAMLDEEHDRLPQPATDHNVYTLGRIAGHNVVIAGLYQPGNNPAATVVTQMRTTFPNLKFGVLVGIGGGVPVRTDTGMIRLGHVVVSKPAGGHSGAVQYDHGKAKAGRFERTGALAPPPAVLFGAAQELAAKRARAREDPLGENIKRIDTSIRTLRRYKYPGAAEDRLHRRGYEHRQPVVPCDECGCDPLQRIVRPTDDEGDEGDEPYIAVHRGTVASGELVVKDALLRDRLAEEGLLCFEMEAAGALADFPCIVIRGISDYCDSHKNDQWHGYVRPRPPQHMRGSCEQGGGPRKVGVWGFGGGGKSQLALSYLQHYRHDYDATFWIQAGQPASIDRDFVEIRRLLPHSASGESNGPEEVRQDVLAWFARRTGKWLFVFDGADHLDKNDNKFTDFLRYIPNSADVHVDFTSRSTVAERLSTFGGVRVAELEEDQAVTLFVKHVTVPRARGRTEEEARAIVEELGRLALAVTIAASYVADTPRLKQNLTQYLEEFRRRRRQLLDRLPDGLADRYDHSVMTVWETSYAAVHDRLPEACRLLTLLAFVNYEDIFLELFGLRPDAGGEGGRWMSVVSDQAMDLQRVEECFAVLERYSLVQQQADAEAYSIHRLVHAWDRDRLGAEEIDRFCRAALEMLYSATQDCGDGPETKRRLVPHLRANFDEVARLGIDAEEEAVAVVDCVEAIGVFTGDIGSWGEAAAMKKEVLEKR
ncbi:hypothetical protein GE09DRAFT_1217350 [Coniochaeta sp. 2T2.1]|nr:hypothetical protein GE09DRAFT_1217350 [Coniochaeta sp. 2T2.1]